MASRRPVQTASLLVGLLFVIVGVLGFVPGITVNHGAMTFAGHHSGALLLGLFQVSILHNLVHLLFGVLGIALARSAGAAKQYLIVGGIVYAVLWVYGLFFGHSDHAANFVPLNNADNWLHLVLAIGMIALGFLLPGAARTDARRP